MPVSRTHVYLHYELNMQQQRLSYGIIRRPHALKMEVRFLAVSLAGLLAVEETSNHTQIAVQNTFVFVFV